MFTADTSHTVDIGAGKLIARRVPGGCWAVKVRERGGAWVVFAVPRDSTTGRPFDIGSAERQHEAERAGFAWVASAAASTPAGRIFYVGLGDAPDETFLPGGTWYSSVAPSTPSTDL